MPIPFVPPCESPAAAQPRPGRADRAAGRPVGGVPEVQIDHSSVSAARLLHAGGPLSLNYIWKAIEIS